MKKKNVPESMNNLPQKYRYFSKSVEIFITDLTAQSAQRQQKLMFFILLEIYNFVQGVRSKEESVPILLFLLLLLISLALNLQSPSNKVLFGLFLSNIILHFG